MNELEAHKWLVEQVERVDRSKWARPDHHGLMVPWEPATIEEVRNAMRKGRLNELYEKEWS